MSGWGGENVQPMGDRARGSDQAVVPRPDMRPFFEILSHPVPDEMTRWRKLRGSLTRDRRGRVAADPLLVLRATAPRTTAIWIREKRLPD